MFRLHKLKSDKSRLKIDFNFSNFQLLQVPKGWDKLFVSIISVETGKTIARSGKASVRNGNCRWTETISEFVYISREDATKELEQCLLKLVVATGSTRSGILGEATVNLACYVSSKISVPVSLPLNKCNHGTTLQVKIQCLSPVTNFRDEKQKDDNLYTEDVNADYDEIENKSDTSDTTFTRSVGSSSSNCLDSSSHLGELGTRETSFSPSGSHNSFESFDSFPSRETFSPRNEFSGIMDNSIGGQDSTGSRTSSPYASYPNDDLSRSNRLSFNSKVSTTGSHLQSNAIAASPLRNAGSSKDLLEAAELTIKELRAEARMWERNARKLMVDLEIMRKQCSEQSKNQEKLDMELSVSRAESDGLMQEIKQLKILLEDSFAKQTATENLKVQSKDVEKEVEDELKFQKESNADLAVQLQKTQESNIELVSILQELEETIEEQKMEIANLMTLKLEVGDAGKYSNGHEESTELNSSQQDLAERKRKIFSDSDLAGNTVEQYGRDLHTRFDPENSRNVELKLQQLQESQKNLETTIQLMEKTLENRNQEIDIERALRTQSLSDCEAEWKRKFDAKEEEVVNLEARLSEAFYAQGSNKMGSEDCLLKEIEVLTEKVQGLERDCNDLADENLELQFKLKEPRKDLQTCDASSNSLSHGLVRDDSFSNLDSVASNLKFQICLVKESKNENIAEGVATSHLQIQSKDLEDKCTDMALQLQAFKDKSYYLEDELNKFHAKTEEQKLQIASLQQEFECCQGKEAETMDHNAFVFTKLENYESGPGDKVSIVLTKLCDQLQLYLANMKKQQYTSSFPVDDNCNCGFENVEIPKCTDSTNQKWQIDALLNNLVQLKFFEAKSIVYDEDTLQHSQEIRDRVRNNIEVPNKSVGSELTNMDQDCEVTNLRQELHTKCSETEESKIDYLLQEENEEALNQRRRESETRSSNLLKEKLQLEKDVEMMRRQSNITSKCLSNIQTDMALLRSSMDSQVSTNKNLERKSSELESGNCELEFHISELEEETVQLSERVSGLEAQVRHLTDEKESTRSELQHSESRATSLQEEIRRLETELETQKNNMKQKLSDMQKRWSEAQEECEYLKRANPKLKATAESLIEECSLLQKSNGKLKKQKVELHEHCTLLEAELRESRKSFFNCSMKFGALEAELSSMLEEVSLKEKTINLELDALIHENEKHNENLFLEETLLQQMYLEKKVEVDSLRKEVAYLTEQMHGTESEKVASKAVLEVSCLRRENTKLEAALQEIHEKLNMSEKKFDTLQMESEAKVLALSDELSTSKQNQDVLLVDHEKLLGLVEDVKCNEQKLKSIVNGLKLKLKASEYERQQLLDEISALKVQLQKIAVLQDEVLTLKSSLNEAKYENERLEALFQLLSGDYEDIKSEKFSLVEKVSCMQRAATELEDCIHSKGALQEKILRLEGDLTAREALSAQDTELKIELCRIRRTNSQFQRKIKFLEEEKEGWLQRAQALEEELKLKTVNEDRSKPTSSNTNSIKTYKHDDLMLPEVNIRQDCETGSFQAIGVDPVSTNQFCGIELSDASEAIDMCKTQLTSSLSKEQNGHSDIPVKLKIEVEATKEEQYEHKASLVTAELKDLRERYFQMSLKYAEVEAQREELVMKLKGVNNRRAWFS